MDQENKSSIGKIIFGIAFLVLAAILFFGKPEEAAEKLPDHSFKDEPVIVEGFIPYELEEASLPTRILIPSLSIDLSVKKAKIIEGYWELFEDSAAWGEGSGLPGAMGNQVIFAHAREGLFLPLREIQKGMKVYVLSGDKWFSYEVDEIKEVDPDQTEVIAETEDEKLTLYTCSGFADSKRLIVVAKRI